ncbi:AfsR/SARP family transcriptional regulator [Kitasatospora acidiphila]|uniref:AfsR/SARP family transcriptional regulator n=1 Tax=Kitasatospora acidiphila TaxID=2567942 RepID=UPI0015F07B17|nr:BTAD domain-containing putative transcriptional regulator [Kitasatospora acidiphila]
MDKINFRVLGPLEVRRDGRWLPVSSGKQRQLLALLISEAGRVVATHRLVDELWDEHPPTTGAKVVATYVFRLRTLLGDPDGSTLVTRAPGYLLAVDDAQVDAREIGRLAALARAARAAGDLDGAREALDAACALGVGPVLADVPRSPAVLAAASAIESRLLDLREARADVYAELGRHEELLPELAAAVAEHPYRESLAVRLIRALRGAGRRGEALEAYRRTRQVLVGELGVEPGSELRSLQRELLSEPNTRPTRRATPSLPAPPAHFVGRTTHLATLSQLLPPAPAPAPAPTHAPTSTPAPLVVLSGMPGSGKTALALQIGTRLADRFPDGQVFLTVRHSTGTRELVADLLQALGVPRQDLPGSPNAADALLRRVLAATRVLLVLDDVRTATEVRPLLSRGPGCAILVTSRSGLPALEGAHRIPLGPLPEAESLSLLSRLAGAERVAAEPQAAARIVRLCGRLPLAVRIVGAKLASRPAWPLAMMVDRLQPGRSRLDHLELDDLSVRGSLSASYESLAHSDHPSDRHAALLLRSADALSLPRYSVPVLARLSGLSTAQAGLAADRLVDAALFTEPAPGQYTLHNLVREFAGEVALRVGGGQACRLASSVPGPAPAHRPGTVPFSAPPLKPLPSALPR